MSDREGRGAAAAVAAGRSRGDTRAAAAAAPALRAVTAAGVLAAAALAGCSGRGRQRGGTASVRERGERAPAPSVPSEGTGQRGNAAALLLFPQAPPLAPRSGSNRVWMMQVWPGGARVPGPRRKPKERVLPRVPAATLPPAEATGGRSAAGGRGTHLKGAHALHHPSAHRRWRQHFLHNFYFKLQRMLHTLMNLYLNRSARDQG